MSSPMLVYRDVYAGYRQRAVTRSVSLTAARGEVTGLIGPNGSGKSTLARAAFGLASVFDGEIELDRKVLRDWSRREKAQKAAYLPQDTRPCWPLSVYHTVALGRIPHSGARRLSRQKERKILEQVMEQAGIGHLSRRPVDELSGGEQMRVMLARMLAVEGSLLVLDEPVRGLDLHHQLQVLELIRTLSADRAVLIILHDLSLASRFCDRLYLLDEGRVCAEGRPEEVLTEDILSRAYRVESRILPMDEGSAVIPWRRL